MRNPYLFAIVLIITISLLLVVEAFHIFWRPHRHYNRPGRKLPMPGPSGPASCQSCTPGTGDGNPSGCKLADNYRKCKAWEAQHPGGCCVYDANKGFTCYEGGSQCQGWSCDNAYDNSGFACVDGGKKVPIAPNPWTDCKMC